MEERVILDQFELLVARFEAAWNCHDTRELASLFAVDAEFVNVAGLWWRGRDQIEAALVRYHASAYKSSVLSVRISTAKVLSPEMALVICQWDLVGQRGAGGVLCPPEQGVLSWMLTRNIDNWQVSVSQNTYKLDSNPQERRDSNQLGAAF